MPGSTSSFRYRTGSEGKYAESAVGDDEDGGPDSPAPFTSGSITCANDDVSVSATTFMAGGRHSAFPGGPFSALIPSMCPQDLLAQLQKMEDSRGQPEYRFDEFGFKVEVEDGPEQNSSKILSVPFVEDPQHRLKWIAHLEFTHNQVVEELTWAKVEPMLPRSDKLKAMIRAGVPHSLRPYVWPRLCGATIKRKQAQFSYKEIMKGAKAADKLAAAKQIEKDLLRTLPHNACFMSLSGTGIPRLRRILRGVAYLYPDIGYCQGMGVIACSLLLVMDEEDAFWMMASIIEDLLPASYYCNSLIGVQADQHVLSKLLPTFLPETDKVLKEHDIELSLISLHWFLTLFSSVVHMKVLVRLWDIFFYEGSVCLFQFALGMLKMREADLRACENSAELFNLLSDLPVTVEDADLLLQITYKVAPSLTESLIATHRKKHLAYLMAEQGLLVNPDVDANLPKQHIQRRKLKRSQSIVSHIFKTGSVYGGLDTIGIGMDDVRMKNIRQTELLVDLKDAILKVARHFLSVEPAAGGGMAAHSSSVQVASRRHSSSSSLGTTVSGSQSAAALALGSKVILQADYSLDSHVRDHEDFLAVHRSRRRRARALLDFERHDDDELGFKKNDVITIISQKDEHCWIGELGGVRGWFPAKFVQMLDERSKNYSVLGDDAVTEVITDLVRGFFCKALKAIFDHGIKRSSVIGGPVHPWLFIEEVAKKEVQRDFDSVYSRLVLCRTFRLDEDGKVLTPEELLFRAVHTINLSHDARHAQMDVKFRSLVCVGLSEQVLHLWFELLCSSAEAVRRWYHRWSFIRSPGWVGIKCELRVLAQFAFNLNPDWELIHRGDVIGSGGGPPGSGSGLLAGALTGAGAAAGGRMTAAQVMVDKPLKEGVRDMLVKHHLFSWDL